MDQVVLVEAQRSRLAEDLIEMEVGGKSGREKIGKDNTDREKNCVHLFACSQFTYLTLAFP